MGLPENIFGKYYLRFQRQKILPWAKGGGSYGMIKYALEALGLSFADFDAKYLSVAESVNAWKDGSIEGYFVDIGTPSSAFMDLAMMPSGLKLISLSLEDLKKCHPKYNFLTETVIPANTYKGPTTKPMA